ncbi:hypothetical protein ACNSTQ_22900 [Alkalihalobacterium sp. APHAB7]
MRHRNTYGNPKDKRLITLNETVNVTVNLGNIPETEPHDYCINLTI